MKLFKWIIETKIKRVDGDERIVFLANELLKALNNQGYCIRSQVDFANLNISVHGLGRSNDMRIWNCTNDLREFQISGKLTTDLMNPKKEANAPTLATAK